MKTLNLCLGIAWLLACNSVIAAVADRFDYPIGNRGHYTEADNDDGWRNDQEFGVWNAAYSKYHLGEDWNAESGGNTDCGLPVYAVANGTIVYAAIATGWGRVLIVRHTLPGGTLVESLYGHLGSFAKTSGDVARGEQIGTIGDGSEGGVTFSCHLHLEVRTAACPNWGQPGPGYSVTSKPAGWTDPSRFLDMYALGLTTLQPGPLNSKDIWTTSVYSFTPSGGGPGGGLNDYKLRVGGWADLYYSLIQFDLSQAPSSAVSAVLYLYCFYDDGSATPMYLDRITQAWDWRTSGTGRDRERLWWADRPAATQWIPNTIPAGVPGQWYAVDITGLYNAWQSGLHANYGLQLRPQNNWNNYNAFYSADYAGNPTLRPKLVITAPAPVAPGINVPPQSQSVQAAANVVFSVTATGTPPLSYQWRKDGMNILGVTGATLTLNSVGASASGDYSVVVWNAYGSAVSATAYLAVLADGANGTTPGQLVPPVCPLPQPAADSLVLVTHGWIPVLEAAVLPSWVTDLANAIQSSVPSGWQVVPIDWALNARTLLPDMALVNGKIKGTLLGEKVASESWQHVHLIGKSAGAALIQAAADTIRRLAPYKEVHTTFLDPYLGLFHRGRSWYGMNADWSENYFAHDRLTDMPESFTEGPLDNAFNVNVTWADPAKLLTPIYCPSITAGSTPPTLEQVCGYEAWSSHDWPRDFYFRTVLGTQPTCISGFGFPMSKEGGGWDSRGTRPIGQAPLVPCGQPPATQNPFPMRFDFEFRFDLLPSATSGAGVSLLGNTSFMLNSGPPQLLLNQRQDESREPKNGDPTGTPAWLAVGVATSNAANFVQFDAGFTSTNGAQGLMTVYWTTNLIGTVDERIESPGLHTYRFALPGAVSNGLYTLSFRLDSFTNTTSSVTVTNVTTGFAGVSQPLTLGMVRGTNGAPLLELTGAAGYNYLVETSTNLVDWNLTALLVNTNGTVRFPDPAVTNSSQRFYRVVMP